MSTQKHFHIAYLWKISSSLSLPSEESQFKSQKPPNPVSLRDPPLLISCEVTFGAGPLSSYFLWPKSQFGLFNCISLKIIIPMFSDY